MEQNPHQNPNSLKEYTIVFSGPMVKAIQAGRKSVTRRLSKQWLKVKAGDRLWVRETCLIWSTPQHEVVYRDDPEWDELLFDKAVIEADRKQGKIPPYVGNWKKTPSIHMPRWASRILLECEEDARPERLQDITEDEAVLEGCEETPITDADIREAIENPMDESKALMVALGPGMITAKADYMMLWDDLHPTPPARWEDNPTVIRLRFRRINQK